MPRPNRWPDVVAAAAKVFREKGFDGATVEDVASEVGMLKGSLYTYITSKEDLLFAVVRPPADHLLELVRTLSATKGPAIDRIRELIRAQVRVLHDFDPYAAVYLHEIAGLGRFSEWSTMDREYVDLLTSLIEAGIRERTLRKLAAPRIAALSLLGSVNWMTRWYRNDGPLTPDQVADQIVDLFLDGARRLPPKARTPKG